MNTRRSPHGIRLAHASNQSESPPLFPAFLAAAVISGSSTRHKLCGAKQSLLPVERCADIGAILGTIATTTPIAGGRNA